MDRFYNSLQRKVLQRCIVAVVSTVFNTAITARSMLYGGEGSGEPGGIMKPDAHHPMFFREHVLPAVEAAMASMAFATVGGGNCPPTARRDGVCPLTVSAMVVDPRTSTDVFNYLRGLAHPWDSAFPDMPAMAVITVSDSGRTVVHFLRN